VSDGNLPVSRKAQREQAKEALQAERAAEAVNPLGSSLLKRKRNDIDESDPKLKEFLQVMQPKSKSKVWNTETLDEEHLGEPPKKVQALELPEADSDNEYEMVPKKSRKEQLLPEPAAQINLPTATTTVSTEPEPGLVGIPKTLPEPTTDPAATDDDWVRSRTNRLLDLVDPTDVAVFPVSKDGQQTSSPIDDPIPAISNKILAEDEHISKDDVDDEIPSDKPDNTEEVIRASGRLFVRNLPFTATEEDISRHFETYGPLEEVIAFSRIILNFMMNIQIGTSYAYKHLMRAGRIF
jgi:multiple RNA-binding domain-containing protein 1